MPKLIFTALSILVGSALHAQDAKREFEIKEGDTTYIMKQYFMVFLHSGEKTIGDSAKAAAIQMAHLTHLDSLAKEGLIPIKNRNAL